MNPTGKKAVGLFAAIVVLVAIVAVWHFAHRATNPLVATNKNGDRASSQNVGDFDQFQQDLASRVQKQFGGGSDFSVIVATTAYPLGTLLRATGSVPADLEDCVPAPPPTPFAAQHLFPSYMMSTDTALTANLGSGALQGLTDAGVNLKQSQSIQYTIADTQIQIMDDKSVEHVTAQGDCGKFISAHPGTRLVRGTVLGKMTFLVKVDNPATVKAQLAKIGGFNINDNPGSSTLSIADNVSQPIVLLLSEFGTNRNASVSCYHSDADPSDRPRVSYNAAYPFFSGFKGETTYVCSGEYNGHSRSRHEGRAAASQRVAHGDRRVSSSQDSVPEDARCGSGQILQRVRRKVRESMH